MDNAARRDGAPDSARGNAALDEIDRRIIRSLAEDGRLSFRELGNRIHLSPNATAERVRRLQDRGVICGFHALIDPARIGTPLEAYIDVRLHSGTSADSLQTLARRVPGVMTFAVVTGEFDCRVRVACKDQADLMRLIEALRAGGGIQGTNTAVICREIKVGHGMT